MPAKRLMYGATVFWSALLLFLVQPMMAKAILPWFGGSAGVWTACMLFFQVVLLLGYLYADWIARHVSPRGQAAVHVALLALSLFGLPVRPAAAWKPEGAANPILGILGLLAVSLGLPYFLLSTTGPLMQSWYARAKVRYPYRLFAVSNLASLAALLSYPEAIEPFLSTGRQMQAWSAAYGAFVLLAAAAAWASSTTSAWAPTRSDRPSPADRLLWIVLAACASALWLSVANHVSQNVAPVPFLWILPLSIYLLSFILCFDRRCWYSATIFRWLLPAGWLAMFAGFLQQSTGAGLKLSLWLFLAGLLACCLFCHGELASRKPDTGELTSFYLMLALGGAAGGVFVGVIAPTCFDGYLELPLSMAGCILLAMGLLYRCSTRRLATLAAVAGAAFFVSIQVGARNTGNRVRLRNFYGVLRVTDTGAPGAMIRVLSNGTIQHGIQFLDPARSMEAAAYYGPESGAALALRRRQGIPQRVGVIGLGAGTLASFAGQGDEYRFYELNPQVIRLARTEFHFLRDSQARVQVVAGDARLALEREPPQHFDVLAVDAFTGDAIPVHLLTREAFDLYFRHLKEHGILAVHITNRYLELAPVVLAAADARHGSALFIRNRAEATRYVYDATWVLVASTPLPLSGMRWAALPFPSHPKPRLWTDDYSNLFQVLR
jgi:hypothetical protein